MRSTLVFGLTLSLSVAAAFADGPIPQDKVRLEQRSRDRLEWNRQTLQGAYDKIGKKDPRWDQPAREALELAAAMFSEQLDPVVSLTQIHVPARKAVEAGSDDPMILYLYARTSVVEFFPTPEEYNRRMQLAADAMSKSAYSPYRRAVALSKVNEAKELSQAPTPEERRDFERGLDAVLDLLALSATEDPRTEDWDAGWFMTITPMVGLYRKSTGDSKTAFDRIDARLVKIPGIEALRLTIKGKFLVNWAWEARTTAFAPGVSDQQFRTFGARLQEARDTLNKAWEARPGQPEVANLMMTVEKGIGGGDRETMETWFDRAMKANGNDQDACWQKLDWLDPRWYGGPTPEPMMEFGRACMATKNWRAKITLIVADAHLRYYSTLAPKARPQYMKSPEVWSEIKSVYDEYLQHVPLDDLQRSKYATFCYLSAHYAEAHAEFQTLGDRLTPWPSTPNYPIATMKRFRDESARIVAGKPRTAPAPAP